MIELWRMTSIRVNLDLKSYYKYYKSLLFYEELDRVEFSLCDQYWTIHYTTKQKKTCF